MLDEKKVHELKKAFPFVNELDGKHEFFDSLYYQKIEPGMVILDESHKCTGVILMLSGVIRIYKLSDEGREITLYRIGRGETCTLTLACLLGIGEVPFPVAASAEQLSEAVFVPAEIFKKLFYSVPSIQKFFFMSLSAKFYSVLNLLENITFKRTSERLMDFLITKTAGGTYPLYSTHEAIGAELGTAREVVSRLLKEMESNGIVTLSRGKITLLDKAFYHQ
ncbi:MAG TPA: Crp/Fnr family transcriptional regulator [Ruminiclostridium sp.]|nr:Crp/Fnr family transcriptional regulator [Ruminiclostridium sp.]